MDSKFKVCLRFPRRPFILIKYIGVGIYEKVWQLHQFVQKNPQSVTLVAYYLEECIDLVGRLWALLKGPKKFNASQENVKQSLTALNSLACFSYLNWEIYNLSSLNQRATKIETVPFYFYLSLHPQMKKK